MSKRPKLIKVRLLFNTAAFFSCCFIGPRFAAADNSQLSPNLRNPGAQERSSKVGEARGRRSISGLSSSSFNGSELRADTVQDVLQESRVSTELGNEYQSLQYLRYIDRGFAADDEEEDERIAQKLFLLHGFRTLSSWAVTSPFEPWYRSCEKTVKQVGAYTKLSVVQGSRGGLGVERGELEKKDKLLQFRLHASLRNGIEPRVKFGEYLHLRINPFKEQTVLEFEKNF